MSPRVPRQARSRAKYQAILQAALELFRERGYAETTVDAIVERSRVSVGVFYSYFASKQEVLLSLFQQEMISDDLPHFPLPERAWSLDETEAFTWAFIRQRSRLLRARQELLLIDPEFARYERALQQRRKERLARVLEQRQAAGYIRQDVHCTTCAWILLISFARFAEMLDEQSEQEIAGEVHAAALLIHHMLHTDENDRSPD